MIAAAFFFEAHAETMSPSPHRVAAQIERALASYANPARAAVMSGGYAPSRLRYFGASNPEMRSVMRQFSRELRGAAPALIRDVALALVRRGTAEGRQIGYELFARRRDAMALLIPALVRRFGRGNDNWASVDGFALFIAGPAWRLGRVSDAEVVGWARSRDPWWRRTALASAVTLNLQSRGGTGDSRRTLLICRLFTRETSPMLAKALSWALRSLVPLDKTAVRQFITAHAATLPAIVKREVGSKIRTGKKN